MNRLASRESPAVMQLCEVAESLPKLLRPVGCPIQQSPHSPALKHSARQSLYYPAGKMCHLPRRIFDQLELYNPPLSVWYVEQYGPLDAEAEERAVVGRLHNQSHDRLCPIADKALSPYMVNPECRVERGMFVSDPRGLKTC